MKIERFQPTPCARSSWTLRLLFQAFVYLNRRRSQEVSRVHEQRTKAAFLLANYKNHQFIVCFDALISACYSVRHRRRSRFCANLENKKHSAQLRIRTRYTARPPALTIEVSFKNHDNDRLPSFCSGKCSLRTWMKRYDLNLCGLGLDNAAIQSPLFCSLFGYTFSIRKANLRPIAGFHETLARFLRFFAGKAFLVFRNWARMELAQFSRTFCFV